MPLPFVLVVAMKHRLVTLSGTVMYKCDTFSGFNFLFNALNNSSTALLFSFGHQLNGLISIFTKKNCIFRLPFCAKVNYHKIGFFFIKRVEDVGGAAWRRAPKKRMTIKMSSLTYGVPKKRKWKRKPGRFILINQHADVNLTDASLVSKVFALWWLRLCEMLSCGLRVY